MTEIIARSYETSQLDSQVLYDQGIPPTVCHRRLTLDRQAFQNYPYDVEFEDYEASFFCDGMIVAAGAAIIQGEKNGAIDIRVWGGGTSPETGNIHFAHALMLVLKECGFPVYRAIIMQQEGGTARIPVGEGERSQASQNYNIPDPQKLLEKLSEIIPEIGLNKEDRPELTFGYSCGAVGATANASKENAAFLLDPVGPNPWDPQAIGRESLTSRFGSSAAIAVAHHFGQIGTMGEKLKAVKDIGKIMTSAWVTPHGNPRFFEMIGLLIKKNPPAAAQTARRLGWPKTAIDRILTREPNEDYIRNGDPAILQRLHANNVDLNITVAAKGMSSLRYPIFQALGMSQKETERILKDPYGIDRITDLNRTATNVAQAVLGMANTTVLLDQSHFSPMTNVRTTVIELLLEKVKKGHFDTLPKVRDQIIEVARKSSRKI